MASQHRTKNVKRCNLINKLY